MYKSGLGKESLDKSLSILVSLKLQPSSIKPNYGTHKVSFFLPVAACKSKTFCSDIRTAFVGTCDKIFFSNEPVSVDFIGLGSFTDMKVRESFFNLFPKSEFISASSEKVGSKVKVRTDKVTAQFVHWPNVLFKLFGKSKKLELNINEDLKILLKINRNLLCSRCSAVGHRVHQCWTSLPTEAATFKSSVYFKSFSRESIPAKTRSNLTKNKKDLPINPSTSNNNNNNSNNNETLNNNSSQTSSSQAAVVIPPAASASSDQPLQSQPTQTAQDVSSTAAPTSLVSNVSPSSSLPDSAPSTVIPKDPPGFSMNSPVSAPLDDARATTHQATHFAPNLSKGRKVRRKDPTNVTSYSKSDNPTSTKRKGDVTPPPSPINIAKQSTPTTIKSSDKTKNPKDPSTTKKPH